MASLAVIVPATNSPRTLTQCLAAIRSSTDPPEELVVVEEPNRYGPAAARNAGVGQTASDVLVFVDADVVLHRDALTRIRDAFDGDDALDALFGSYDDRPGALGVVSQFRNLLHHHVHQNAAGPATTFWAGLGAMRRDVFLEAGGFDAYRFPGPSIEDIELGARLVAQGRRIACDPLLQGTHLKRWTMLGMLRVDLTRRGIPWIALLLESKSPSTALNLGWRHRSSALASLAFVAAVFRRRPWRAGASLFALGLLNRDFYVLLGRRLGPLGAATGILLHVVHHLTSVLSVPGGLALALRKRLRGRRES